MCSLETTLWPENGKLQNQNEIIEIEYQQIKMIVKFCKFYYCTFFFIENESENLLNSYK